MSNPNGVVYLLDDELGMVKAVTRLLRARGFEVHGFTSPASFLEAYRPESDSCLILDVAMPELDGLHLQRRLTHKGILLPVVFLTGHGDIPMSVRAMKAGAVDFLTKPVKDVDLLRAVRAALARFESGDDFLKAVESDRPDCMLLDLHMPRTTGFDVLESMFSMRVGVPIIVITGHDEPGNAERVRDLGAADYLLKPLDESVLIEAIERCAPTASRRTLLQYPDRKSMF